jgi:hypothetical protein
VEQIKFIGMSSADVGFVKASNNTLKVTLYLNKLK